MLYLNNPRLTAHGIVAELKKLPADNQKAIEAFRKKLGLIYFPQMTAEKIKAEIESERFAEFPQLQFVLREIFVNAKNAGVIAIPAEYGDWNPPANYTNKTFQELNNTYGYFQPNVSPQGESIFNTLKPLCRKMTQLVERQADDNEMAYKLMALLCEPTDLLDADKCLENIAKDFFKISQQIQHGTPYHDAFVTILHSFPTATDAKNIQAWREFIKNVGFSGLLFFADCASFESVPASLKEAQEPQLTKTYPRAKENLEFAKFCKKYRAKNDEFEKGLDFIKTGWPKKTTDNLPLVDIKLIDRGTNTEYRWVKLPPNDKRALYLGIMIPGCCQVINGDSRQCVIDGTSLSDNGFYVLLKKKVKESEEECKEECKEEEVPDSLDGDIVAQSYAWISQNGNLCLDSIEWDEARVTEPILKTLMDEFADAVFQHNPQIKYINVGTGGQTPKNFSEEIKIPERQRQGTEYGDASSQFCIKSRLNPEDVQKLQTQLTGLDEQVKDKILYLAPYFASTEFSPDMIQNMSKLLTSSFFQPFPKVPPLLTALDFETLTFEEYQQLPDDKKTQVSTFCKLLNCGNLESFVKWLPEIPEQDRLEAVKAKDSDGNSVLHSAARNPESLRAIFELLPEQDRREAVKATNRYGTTVLHSAAARNPESLRAIFELLPEQARLEAVNAKDRSGNRVLHYAARNPESLRAIFELLPEQERITFIEREGIIHRAAKENADSLRIVLEYIPEDKRLEAMNKSYPRNSRNQSIAMEWAFWNIESLKLVLELYPEDKRIEALNLIFRNPNWDLCVSTSDV
jgi:hypothetical protein